VDNIVAFLSDNKEWIFSGIGVALMGVFISLFQVSTRKRSHVARSSLNVQVGRNIDIRIGSQSDNEIISKIEREKQPNE
jgi:hypothetical protein